MEKVPKTVALFMLCHYMYTCLIEPSHKLISYTCEAGIAERVSALDWLSLRYAAIITLPVSNPGLCP